MSVRPFHHQRPLAAVAAMYGAGVWAGVSFSWRPAAYGAGLLLCGIATALLPLLHRRRILGWMGVFLFLGMLLGGRAAHPILPEAGEYAVRAVAAMDAEQRADGTAAIYLEQAVLRHEQREIRLPRLYWTFTPAAEEPILPREGDGVAFTGRLYHPWGQENPYGFDFRLFLLERGALAGLSGAKALTVTGHPGRGPASWCYQARKGLAARLDALFGPDSALPKALLLGLRQELPRETTREFADAGVAHLLAVSGLHVALLAGAWMLILRQLMPPTGRLPVLALLLLAYCALLDFSAPVVRASLLLIFYEGRRILRRSPDRLTALAAAFLLILLVRPLALFSASFQLSFGAMLGIALFMPWLDGMASRRGGKWLQAAGVSWSAGLGAALPTIQIFHRVSLLGLAVNPAACLIFSILVPAYALALMLGCVWLPAGQALAAPLGAVGRWVMGAVSFLGKLPFASVAVPFLPWYCVGALILAGVMASRFAVGSCRKKLALSLLALSCAFGAWQLSLCRDVQYIQFSVGQADAALILDGDQTVVIDAGAYGGDLAGYLLSTGRRADHLMLSHLHRDHCLGVRELLNQRVKVGRVYLPQGAEDEQVDPECLALLAEMDQAGIPITHLSAGDTLALDRVSLEVTWPRADSVRPGQDANRYSMVLLCDLDGVKLLTTGDLTGDYEGYAARTADVLKVAHHGSGSATWEAFLQSVSPSLALISASGSETAALPHPSALARLRGAGIPFYSTGQRGALTLTIHQGQAILTPYLPSKEQP